MGKILAAAWRGSKFEIQGVLRDVCDKVLDDKTVKLQKRIERAEALMLCGAIYLKVRSRTCLLAERVTNVARRLRVILTKKATIWLSNSLWPSQ